MLEFIILIAAITVMVILPLVLGFALNNVDDYLHNYDAVGKCTMEDYYLADLMSR